jgi:glutamate racemase
MRLPLNPGPIGVFDSGYGGLTILHGIRQLLPDYNYIYLGDNARAPTEHARSMWYISLPVRLLSNFSRWDAIW